VAASAGSGNSVAVVPPAADTTMSFTMPVIQNGMGGVFRAQDANNY